MFYTFFPPSRGWCEDIVNQVKAGGRAREKAFLEMLRKFRPMVRSSIRKLGLEEAQAVHALHLAMIELEGMILADRLENPQKVYGLLVRMFRSKTIDEHRKNKTQEKHFVQKEELPEVEGPSVLDHIYQDEDRELLQSAIRRLGEGCRKILVLFYYKRYSIDSIAADLGYGKDSVKTQKSRCLKKLRSHLEPVELFDHS